MNTTFVTSFFDIGRKTDATMQKFDNYFAWIKQLLELPINIYFFTTPELHEQFNYTPRSNLIFKLIPEAPYFDRIDKIKEAWTRYQTGNPSKDTAEFGAITHAKFIFLCQAIAHDPFGDINYSWIDAGLLKIATDPELIPNLKYGDKIKLMMLGHVSREEVERPDFVSTCQYKFAAGLFGGPKQLMRIFCLRMIAQAEYDLYIKRFGLEQEYMAIIYRKYPELFAPYYGSFCDLIVNHNSHYSNYPLIKNILLTALKNNDKDEAIKVIKYVQDSPYIDDNQKHLLQNLLPQ